MRRSPVHRQQRASTWLALALATAALAALPARAADLHPETLQAFNRYIQANDARFDREIKDGPFLWVDAQSGAQRDAFYQQLRAGEVVIKHVAVTVEGKELDIPDGIIHHWLGVVFIPGVTLQQTLRLLQDYDHHLKYYAPDVTRSKLLEHKENFFRSYLRFFKKKVLTVVIDTEHEAIYQELSSTRAISRSHTTRVNEVENHDEAGERLKPEGHDGGFLWRLNTYWRIEEKDGGTYVQCEGVTLTRGIPLIVKWIIEPYISSVPKESLLHTLGKTREALQHPPGAGSSPAQ